jgi:hypothetical protein
MSNSGIQSPLGINTLGSLLSNQGLAINPVETQIIGVSQSLSTYTAGTIVNNTCLNYLVQAIDEAYTIGIDTATYNNLISIGSSSIPALGDSKPSTYVYTGSNVGPLGNQPAWGGANYTAGNEATRYGYLRLIALQAYDEFNYNDSLPEYKDFLNSIQVSQSYMNSQNSTIQTLQNSKTFLTGTYSNINALITGDISGVNLATLAFGKDLQNLGKSIDLTRISTFGLPSNLLLTLQKYSAITKSLSIALLSTGLTTFELKEILTGLVGVSKSQEQKLYQAFSIILGQDLFDILIPLNCKTQNLQSLLDLLNPIKLFPNSYQSLTVPVYNLTPTTTNSKTYYLIYNNQGVNSQLNQPAIANQIGTITPPGPPPILSSIPTNNQGIIYQAPPVGFGSYLDSILPADIATAAGAFSFSMQQIKNITNVPIEKFAQVVSTLETTKDLSVNGTSIPVDVSGTDAAIATIALGSGPYGAYTLSDFFGCMSSLPYDWTQIQTLINELETNRAGSAGNRGLYQIYEALYNTVLANNPSTPVGEAAIQVLIDEANTEIQTILTNNGERAEALNALWEITGTQLTTEQRARSRALFPVPVPRDGTLTKFPESQMSFVDAIPSMAPDTRPHMYAQTLEAIADLSTLGGQSMIGMLRETRNQIRLSIVGIPLDNNISQTLTERQNKELVANGMLPGTIPAVLRQIDQNGNLIQPERYGVYNPSTNTYDSIYRQDESLVPGSLADPENIDIIPELDPVYFSDITLPSTPSVQEAVDEVIRCNCDCWDNL